MKLESSVEPGCPASRAAGTETGRFWRPGAILDLMSEDDASDSKRLKSAYELALERMEQRGIEKPRQDAFDADSLEAIAEARSRADAKLAEMEILHKKQLLEEVDPSKRLQSEQEYRAERQRVEGRREREIAKVRESAELS